LEKNVMTAKKIYSVVSMYRARFEKERIPKKRMDPQLFFASKEEMLAHAHYLLDGIEKYVKDPNKKGKCERHLGSCQTLLWVAGWHTLEELINHNRPTER